MLRKGLSHRLKSEHRYVVSPETLSFIWPVRAGTGGGWSLGPRLACPFVILGSVAQTYPQAKVEKEEHVESHVDL